MMLLHISMRLIRSLELPGSATTTIRLQPLDLPKSLVRSVSKSQAVNYFFLKEDYSVLLHDEFWLQCL